MLKRLDGSTLKERREQKEAAADEYISDDELSPRALMSRLTDRLGRKVEERLESRKLNSN